MQKSDPIFAPNPIAGDDQTCGDSDPHLQIQINFDPGYGIDNVQSDPDRALRIVLMRPGIAEIDQNAVAQILGHMALEACHLGGTGFLIAADDGAEIFRVEFLRNRRRANQIAEHQCQLPPFRFGVRRWRYRRSRTDSWRCQIVDRR